MKIYFQGDKIEHPSCCIALGNFDGVHIGHLAILNAAKEAGKSFGALLFKNHTHNSTVITPLEDKIEILKDIGADFVYVVNFDNEFKSKSVAEFTEFLKYIGVEYISVGYDYRCGKGASADSYMLKETAEKFGIITVITDAVLYKGSPVKSTDIRELIKSGDIEKANLMLYKPYTIKGSVVSGFQNGRKMGFPTANIEVEENILLPADGVYYGRCVVNNKPYKVIINVGANPTLNAKKRTVEGHIIGIKSDLYGRKLSYEFRGRIRKEMKFSSLDELKTQIEKDKNFAIEINF